MNKREFLNALKSRLSGLPEDDARHWLDYYAEMIDDRVEDGMSEEAAVADLGGLDAVVASILAETPITKLARAKLEKKRALKGWHIALIAIGSPIWLALLIALLAVIFAVFVVLFSLIISAFSIVASFIGTAIGCMASAFTQSSPAHGLTFFGVGLVFAGLSVLACVAAIVFSKWVVKLIKAFVLFIKARIAGKERV